MSKLWWLEFVLVSLLCESPVVSLAQGMIWRERPRVTEMKTYEWRVRLYVTNPKACCHITIMSCICKFYTAAAWRIVSKPGPYWAIHVTWEEARWRTRDSSTAASNARLAVSIARLSLRRECTLFWNKHFIKVSIDIICTYEAFILF